MENLIESKEFKTFILEDKENVGMLKVMNKSS